MHYRRFPLIDDVEVSSLGLGCMRLPTLGQDPAAIDGAALDEMLRAAADVGVNYLDTAYVYHGGAGEAAVGAALDRTGLRGSFMIATKAPVWKVEASADWDRPDRLLPPPLALRAELGEGAAPRRPRLPRPGQGRGQDRPRRLFLP